MKRAAKPNPLDLSAVKPETESQEHMLRKVFNTTSEFRKRKTLTTLLSMRIAVKAARQGSRHWLTGGLANVRRNSRKAHAGSSAARSTARKLTMTNRQSCGLSTILNVVA